MNHKIKRETKPVIAIIGGHTKSNFERMCEEFTFVFDDGRSKGKNIVGLVRNADCVVMMGAVCHETLKKVNACLKTYQVPVMRQKNLGVTSSINKLRELFSESSGKIA